MACAPDSGVLFGWFNSGVRDSKTGTGEFIGVQLEGPTRVGHYFQPAVMNASGKRRLAQKGPLLTPGKSFAFQIDYDPAAGEHGVIHAALDGDSIDFPLKAEDRQPGRGFDRFGLRTIFVGGNQVKVYIDDLSYSAGQ